MPLGTVQSGFPTHYYWPSHSGRSASSLATMRFCSTRGGSRKSRFLKRLSGTNGCRPPREIFLSSFCSLWVKRGPLSLLSCFPQSQKQSFGGRNRIRRIPKHHSHFRISDRLKNRRLRNQLSKLPVCGIDQHRPFRPVAQQNPPRNSATATPPSRGRSGWRRSSHPSRSSRWRSLPPRKRACPSSRFRSSQGPMRFSAPMTRRKRKWKP